MKIKKKFYNNSERTVYFMSDLHYNHFNAIRHGSRPFQTLEEMNQEILRQLEKLKPEDTLFDLGDLFWKTEDKDIIEILESIPCPVYKIVGNHDNENIWWGNTIIRKLVCEVGDIFDTHIINQEKEDYMITLSHYPILSWNHRHYGSINIHGHCHGNIDEVNKSSKELRFDVGWDGEISKSVGSLLIPWSEIERRIKNITGEQISTKDYVTNKLKQL